jgi:hypothetical protein
MGDEELNFTPEEAKGWAHDPRNQEPRYRWVLPLIMAAILGLIVLLAIFGESFNGRAVPPPPEHSASWEGTPRAAPDGSETRQEVKNRDLRD